ncbi:MAG: MATE family efflux transporter [Bacteroidales bacterium]|nr:MATE family efflux transporter [Bacteroidales bacterium]MBD5302174.1 MATE family efflux transporter [Bacteroides sp.]
MIRLSSINRQILKLAVPAIFNNITVPLLGLSDTAITGHLGSDVYLAAMAVGATIFNVIFMLCGFLRMGTTGLAARANGASDHLMARNVLSKALSISLLISVIVLLFRKYISSLLISLIGATPVISAAAAEYFGIVVWSVPAQLAVMAISGWFIGRQNTMTPMIVSVGVNVVNILASVTLVFGVGLGFKGVAFGTLTANWIGLFAMLVFLQLEKKKIENIIQRDRKSKEVTSVQNGKAETEKSKIKWTTFFKVNTNLFFRSACIMGVSLAMTAYGAKIGEVTLAANSVMLQFFLFFSYFMDGFAFAGEALVGNTSGAHDLKGLKKTVANLIKWGCFLSAFFAIVYLTAGNDIVALLSDSENVRQEIKTMHVWLVVLPVVTVWAFIFDGVFIGLARTGPLLVVTLIGALFFFGVAELGLNFSEYAKNSILWLAFEIYLLLRGVLLALEYLILQRKSLIL